MLCFVYLYILLVIFGKIIQFINFIV